MKSKILTTVFVLLSLGLFAQVSVNTDGSSPDGSAMLDVKSIDKGMLVPRMTTAQRTAIGSPATGLLVFDETTGGFWFYNGTSWEDLSSGDNLGDHTATQTLDLNDNKILGADSVWARALNTSKGVTIYSGEKDVVFSTGNFGNGNSTDLFFNKNDVGFNQSEFAMYNQNNNLANNRYFAMFYPTDGDASALNIRKGGNVGIGTPIPDEKLHVAGAIKIVDGSQGTGKLLVSDADGVTSWANPNDGLTVPDPAQPVPIHYQGTYIYVHPTDNATTVSWATAQSTCSALVAYTYDDWYLPTKL